MKKTAKVLTLISSLALCAGFVGAGFSSLNADAATIETPDLYTHGGSVRKIEPTGLRFLSSVSEEHKDAEEVGTIIILKAALEGKELTHNEDLTYIDVEKTQWSNEAVAQMDGFEYEADRYYFNAVLNPIPDDYYGAPIVARAYVKTESGYIYGDPVERSLAQVAAAALAAGEKDPNGNLLKYVDTALANKTLSMNVKSAYMTVGGEQTLEVLNGNGYKAIWSSNNEDVVSVDQNGKVTAKAEGNATVTAKFGSTEVTANIQVAAAFEGEKVIDFTSGNVAKQATGSNLTVGYSNDVLFNGEGTMTLTNTMNWHGSAKILNFNVALYKKFAFSVYQATGGGRTVRVFKNDGSGEVQLKSIATGSGAWTKFEIDVSDLGTTWTNLIIKAGTGGDNGQTGNVFYITDIYGVEALDKVVDFTAENVTEQAKGSNLTVGYSNDIGMMTLTNTMNWHGSATLQKPVSVFNYTKIAFSVYQATGGGRTVRVFQKDASGSEVQLTSIATGSGSWTTFEINVSDLTNKSTALIIKAGTGGDDGQTGNVFYVTDIYGVESLDKVVDFTAENVTEQAKGSNLTVAYSNDIGMMTLTNTMNWHGSATLLKPVDVSAYTKIAFSVYQATGGGRTVRVFQKDASGSEVQLKSIATGSGSWTTFEINVSDLTNKSTALIIKAGTGGDDGQTGNVFYVTDIYGIK